MSLKGVNYFLERKNDMIVSLRNFDVFAKINVVILSTYAYTYTSHYHFFVQIKNEVTSVFFFVTGLLFSNSSLSRCINKQAENAPRSFNLKVRNNRGSLGFSDD